MNHELKHHEEEKDKALLGFWIYLMTDLLMFAVFFAAFAVLRNNTWGGEGGNVLLSPSLALSETILLLTSSFTCGVGMIFARRGDKNKSLVLFLVTLILGASFLFLELSEFYQLFSEGHTPQKSAFLSSFFTLVGAHGLHIFSGLIWGIILLIAVSKRGLTAGNIQKLTLFSLFWHFLDIVWIFIFTVVYLFAAI